MRKRNYLLMIICSFVFLFAYTPVNATTGKADVVGTTNYDYIQEVLKIVNEERSKENLDPLVLDEKLTEKAIIRAEELAASFSHTRPNGTLCFTILDDVFYTAAGENIAGGQSSPSAVMHSWMISKDHMENIMGKTDISKNFTAIGIGHANINGINYWVQLFTDNAGNVFTKTGTESVSSSVEVTIPEGTTLDFSPSLKNSFNSTITLNKSTNPNYQIFESDPVIKYNGLNVTLSRDDFSYRSDDTNIAFVNYDGLIIGTKDGSTKVYTNYNGVDYTYTVNVEGFEEKTIDTFEIKDATLSFSAGDTPVFTGKPGSSDYEIYSEWWEEYTTDANRKSTTNEENKLTTFEAGKKYSYHATFEISTTCGYACNTRADGKGKFILNGTDYGTVTGGDTSGKYFFVFDDLFILDVPENLVPITSVEVNKKELTLTEGDEETLTAKINPENTTDEKTLTWSSSNEEVVKVENGKVTAVKEGAAKVTVKTVNGKEATINITVNKKLVPITSIEVNKKELTLTEGDEETLTAKINPENTTDEKTLTWTSSNEEVVKVENGKVTAVKEGAAKVTVKTVNGKEATINITVNKKLVPITSIEVNKKELTLTEGDEETLTAKINPENTTDEKTLTWSSSNEEVVKVENGKVTAVKEGAAKVTVKTVSGKEETINIIVNKKIIPITNINLNNHDLTIRGIDSSLNINSYEPQNAELDYELINWTSSDESIVMVRDGVLVPINKGTVTITATYNGISDSCTVTVSEIDNSFLGWIKDDNQKYETDMTKKVLVDNSNQLTLELSPELEDLFNDSKIEWVSSNEDIVTVDEEGNLTALKQGEAYITAKYGLYSTYTLKCLVYSVSSEYEENIYVNDSSKLNVIFNNSQSNENDIVWSVDNQNIATISSDGVLTGITSGVVKVTAQSKNDSNLKYSFNINILEREKNIFYVEFDEEMGEITIQNSNGMAVLIINNLTPYTSKEDMPEKDDEEFISLYEIYFRLGSNETFEDPTYIVRLPIDFDINKYEKISVVYIKDGKIIKEVNHKVIDNKYIEFTTNHFSEYAIYGKLKSDKITNTESNEITNNPKTSDNLLNYITLLIISLGMLLNLKLYNKKVLVNNK